ncbi:GntR family transcriptional regulator [Oceanobacillus timonensis]|uniref:GntR family transcriptional regulator n=1 Tax=Oceanobacillus timonensis TaxID=1926285 RepID=UPI0009BB927F|nr:GntR family transcriptional regulator [Oceanobacillus timonensis]
MSKGIKIDTTSLSDKIYNYLLHRIVNNELEPGTRIEYDELIESLNVSRTPLREAINRLSDDGLVEIKPRSGTFVKVPEKKGIENVYDIRIALEDLSVELAMNKIPDEVIKALRDETIQAEKALEKGDVEVFFQSDRNLHSTLIEYADNDILTDFWKTIEAQIQWYGVIMTVDSHRPVRAIESHKKIINSLSERNENECKKYMREHIIDIKTNMLHENFS